MSDRLPPYYFRLRENGATMCRVRFDTRQKRIELEELASVNLRNGAVRLHGGHSLSAEDQAALDHWATARRELLARREADTASATIEQLNQAAHWAQSRASEAELAAQSDALLLAMHDLRTVLLRKKAEHLAASAEPAEA